MNNSAIDINHNACYVGIIHVGQDKTREVFAGNPFLDCSRRGQRKVVLIVMMFVVLNALALLTDDLNSAGLKSRSRKKSRAPSQGYSHIILISDNKYVLRRSGIETEIGNAAERSRAGGTGKHKQSAHEIGIMHHVHHVNRSHKRTPVLDYRNCSKIGQSYVLRRCVRPFEHDVKKLIPALRNPQRVSPGRYVLNCQLSAHRPPPLK